MATIFHRGRVGVSGDEAGVARGWCRVRGFHRQAVACGLLVAAALVGSALETAAQSATLSVAVRDAQGATIAGAALKLTDQAMGVVATARSNEQGLYVFGAVKPATYSLEASAKGFAVATYTDMVLYVDQRVNLEVTLVLESHVESVTVSARHAFLGSADGSVGAIIDRKLAADLPLRGRSFSGLVALTPGITSAAGTAGESGSEYASNGQRSYSNYLTIDGVGAIPELGTRVGGSASGNRPASTITGTLNGLVTMDALQELRIQTSTFAPEFGRTPGAQISIVTRSGTNILHGAVFEQYRDDSMTANSWFVNNTGAQKTELSEHQFGVSAGGPLARNRTFFFGSFEGLRLEQPQFNRVTVPSLDARQLPSPVRDVLNLYPTPTGPGRADGTAEYVTNLANVSAAETYGIRIDHTLFSNTQIFGRYSNAPSDTTNGSPLNSTLRSTKFARGWTAGLTTTIGASTLVDVRGIYGESESGGVPRRVGSILRNWLPADVPTERRLSFRITGVNGLDDGGTSFLSSEQWNLVGSVSRLIGSHHLKAGIDYRRVRPVSERLDAYALNYRTVAEALASPVVFRFDVTSTFGYHGSFQNISTYMQDTWKVGPRLSVTYGVRWDANPVPSFNADEGTLAVTTFKPVSSLALTSDLGQPLWKSDYNNFFPRSGFSYALDSEARLLVRGGVGLFGDLLGPAVTSLSAISQRSQNNTALPLTSADIATRSGPELQPPFSSATAIDPNLETPRTTQWNVNIERALGSTHSISVAYVGARGTSLIQSQQYTRPNSNFSGPVNVTSATGRSIYNALQLQYRHRAGKWPYVLAAYTLSDAKDTTSSIFVTGQTLNELSPADIDVRHTLTAAMSWDVPGPAQGPLSWAIGRWSLNALLTARSGSPFTVYASTIQLPSAEQFRPMASFVPGVPIVLDDPAAPGGRRYNKAAFKNPPEGGQGDTGRNAFRGYDVHQVDMGLQRSIRLAGSYALKIRVDAFNVFNTPAFGLPIGNLESAFFGAPNATLDNGALYRFGGPRSVLASLRFEF